MTSASSQTATPWRRSLLAGLRIAAARLRFFLLLGAVLLLVAAWPTLRNFWDKWTAPAGPNAGVSPDTEYWCPMCPGVLADWPGKCPVCHMSLVVRHKADMTPLPDGVVARMQFSPYRVQLAGIHTSPVEFRPLTREIDVSGLLEPTTDQTDTLARLALTSDVFENDVGLLHLGQPCNVNSASYPGQTFAARITWLAPQLSSVARSLQVRLEIENPRQELRAGMFVTARLRVPLAGLGLSGQMALDGWRDRTALELYARSLAAPFGTGAGSGLAALLDSAVHRAGLQQGFVLAVPESAVIDTGARKIVFLEQAPGLFDAVEVWLGRRCGNYYPVLAGLKPGQAAVTAGAFLLDAETRLNPAAAAAYFGASSRGGSASASPTASAAFAGLSAADQQIVKRQKVCPVTEQPLGSMGAPYRIAVEGHTVFLCCEACAPALKKNPAKYLAKLPQ